MRVTIERERNNCKLQKDKEGKRRREIQTKEKMLGVNHESESLGSDTRDKPQIGMTCAIQRHYQGNSVPS